MIECRIGAETKGRYVKIRGNLTELETDLAVLINSIYNSIRQRNPEAAEIFATTFPMALDGLKDEIFGPEVLEGVSIGTVVKKKKEEAGMIEMSLMECAAHCLLAIGVAGALALVWPSRTAKGKER